MELWFPVIILSLVVLGWLLIPGMKLSKENAKRADYDINVYKDQLTELEREAAEGHIEGSELEAARLEIQRRLLAASEDKEQSVKEKSKGGTLPIFIAAGAAPICAVAFYMYNGSPNVPDHPLSERPEVLRAADAQASAHSGQQAPSMDAALLSLEKRLIDNPNDIDGWILLARSYAGIGNAAKAAEAFSHAVPLADRHPMLLADWAEARLNAQEGRFTEEIFNDFVEARQNDPTLPKPWFYIGLDMVMGGDFQGAVQTWTDLLLIAPDNPQLKQALTQQISKAAEEGSIDLASIKPSDVAKRIKAQMDELGTSQTHELTAPATAAAPPGPTQEDVNAAQEMSAEDRSAFIRSMVARLAERLEENPNDPEGWERLIRAYEVLGETDKAAEARQKLDAITTN